MLPLALSAAFLFAGAHAFYLPGVAPTTYRTGDAVPVYVNTITPSLSQTEQQLKSVISYDCTTPQTRVKGLTCGDYDERFHFCQPPGGPQKQSESLGSILFGDRIFTSPLTLRMMENSACNVLCSVAFPAATEEGDDVAFVNDVVASSYSVNWLIDGLPAARIRVDPTSGDRFYSVGFELGSVDTDGVSLLNNHYDIIVEYHVSNPRLLLFFSFVC